MSEGGAPTAISAEEPEPRLGTFHKLVYGMGDHSVNLSLSALSLLFLFFMTEVAGLRPALAGAVIWIARLFDAVSDPLIGRFSDSRTWKMGRRRPFFLIGMLPFAIAFTLLWRTPFESQGEMFAYYLCIYIFLSLSTTTLSVPYLALLPEMARDYDERTSLNAFRSGCAVSGTLFAVGMRLTADSWGGDAAAYATAAIIFGVWLMVPWLPVHGVSFERNDAPHQTPPPIREGLRELFAHRNFLRLCAIYITARIAVDVGGGSLAYLAAAWLGRPEDFGPFLLVLLCSSILSLPIWLRISRKYEKHNLFIFGAGWWGFLLIAMFFFLPPESPRIYFIAAMGIIGFGYCAADLMPWAMIGEVIDEDELTTGQRREGVYNGFFTFIRKIAGATGVLAMGLALEFSGYINGRGLATMPVQPESALLTIRISATLAPAFFLAVAMAIAFRYPLTRKVHADIRRRLEERNA